MSTLDLARQLRKNQTNIEQKLWYHLRDRRLLGFKFKRQWPIEGYIVDFVCLTRKLVIEVDGSQHQEEKSVKYDNKRTAVLAKKGYKVMRFWNGDITNNLGGVLEKIWEILETSPPALSLKGEGAFP